jgi:hypothetical protein
MCGVFLFNIYSRDLFFAFLPAIFFAAFRPTPDVFAMFDCERVPVPFSTVFFFLPAVGFGLRALRTAVFFAAVFFDSATMVFFKVRRKSDARPGERVKDQGSMFNVLRLKGGSAVGGKDQSSRFNDQSSMIKVQSSMFNVQCSK